MVSLSRHSHSVPSVNPLGGYSEFLPQSKNMHIGLNDDSKLWLWTLMIVYLSLLALWQTDVPDI